LSLAYFIAEDEISFYGLHWDFVEEVGYSGYPLKPYPKPQNRRYNTPNISYGQPNFFNWCSINLSGLI
jgi:hypothetical protein